MAKILKNATVSEVSVLVVSAVIGAKSTTLDTPVSMVSFKGIYQQLGTFMDGNNAQ